ncbi:hypothetical protein OC846_005781 [Tilletia horrida]|uniref:Uncharacterized protein n=1 Tax=Tilletia horrida TaxID=155126 RepID=A0AAN6GMW8_9BASI|nr:hypothetical protein OC846_005781 [Tilletia horrida]KAK0560436.1 hypothetical protein OC861_006278 [Tilletia horrida]
MSFTTFLTNVSEINGRLLEIGIWRTPRNLSVRFPSQETQPIRSAAVSLIRDKPTIETESAVAEARTLPSDLLQEVRSRASAKLAAHGEGRTDRENSLAYNEPGYVRHVLDEDFLKQHVWDACLRPFKVEIEQGIVHLQPGDIPSWLKVLPTEAQPQQELYRLPDAVIGISLSADEGKIVEKMHINVESDLGPTSDAVAGLDSKFLPLMICMNFANLQRPGDKLHPDSDLVVDRGCVSAYAAVVAMRKFYHGATELAQGKGKELPPAPPLLMPIFVDNYLDIWALEWVPEADRLPNKGKPYRCVKMETIHMGKNYEELTILHVWQVRQWAADLLRAYLKALTEI